MRAAAALVDCNPFVPERIDLERRALRDAYVPAPLVWHAEGETAPLNANAAPIRALVQRLGTELRERLAAGAAATTEELADYHRLVLHLLFQRYEDDWYALIEPAEPGAHRQLPGNRAASGSPHRTHEGGRVDAPSKERRQRSFTSAVTISRSEALCRRSSSHMCHAARCNRAAIVIASAPYNPVSGRENEHCEGRWRVGA